MFEQGDVITKAELDALAALANRKLVPQDMSRTFDRLARDLDPAYTPGVMSGAFAFSNPSVSYSNPIGTPPVRVAPRFAWLDELNRIWKCTWNIPGGNPGDPVWDFPWGTDEWDLAPGSKAQAYWGTVPAPGAFLDDRFLVASPGPHCYTTARKPGGATLPVYREVRALYTREQPAFNFLSGLIIERVIVAEPPLAVPDWDHRLTNRIEFENLPGSPGESGWTLYGFYEAEYTRMTGSAVPDNDWGWGLLSDVGGAESGVAGMETAGDKAYIWFGDFTLPRAQQWMGSVTNPIASVPYVGTGDQQIWHWLGTPGWKWTKTTFRGGFAVAPVASTAGSASYVAGTHIVHPRNESIRAALHITHDPHLVDEDYLDFPGLEGLLSNPGIGTRPVDSWLRAMLGVGPGSSTEAMDAYPVLPLPDPEEPTVRALLLTDLNAVIDGPTPGMLSAYGHWIEAMAGVALRPGTRWMLERQATEPEFKKRLHRRLLEDCYATLGRLRRLPPNYSEPETELLGQYLTEPASAAGASMDGLPLLPAHVTLPPAQVIYMALGLPPWASQQYLDYDLPTSFDNGATQGGRRPFNVAGGGYWAGSAISPVPSNWPVLHVKWFGTLHPADDLSPRADFATLGYAPFWNSDPYHRWVVRMPQPALAVGAQAYAEIFINPGVIAQGWRYEFTVGNSNLKIYVSRSDYPDPANPATYEYVGALGRLILPDDFLSATAVDNLWITVKNESSAPQAWQEVLSAFQPAAGEYPPRTDPNFFPQQEPANGVVAPVGGLGYPQGDSYRFGPVVETAETPFPDSTVGRPFPVPPRGYQIRDILVQRQPVTNAAGIRVPPAAADTAARVVQLGLMTGAGVEAGAIYGSYPGDWLSFISITIPASTNEVRTRVAFPVLGGCPLAYYVTDSAGAESAEEFEIFARVEFSPVLNNAFVVEPDRLAGTLAYVRGGFYGPPFLNNTFLFARNVNNLAFGLKPSGPSAFTDINIVIPPVVGRVVRALYDFLGALPDV